MKILISAPSPTSSSSDMASTSTRFSGDCQLHRPERHLIKLAEEDLSAGLKCSRTGRRGLTPAQVVRSLVLMRVKNWDYRELRERIADGYTLRVFSDFYSARVPGHDAFHRAFCRLTPRTLEALNAAVVQAAVDMKLEKGNRLRVDTTVVESDIHYPTDATLLWDCVRVITRQVLRLKARRPRRPSPSAREARRMQELQRMTPTAPSRTGPQVPFPTHRSRRDRWRARSLLGPRVAESWMCRHGRGIDIACLCGWPNG
jgi:IS5 family transposase